MNLLIPCLFFASYCCISRQQWTESCMRRQVSHLKAVLTSSNKLAVTMKWSRKTIFPTHRLKRHLCLCKTCAINSGAASVVLTEGWLHHCACCSSSNLKVYFSKEDQLKAGSRLQCATALIKSWSNLTATKTSGKQKNVGAAICSPQPFLNRSKNVCKASPAPSSETSHYMCLSKYLRPVL